MEIKSFPTKTTLKDGRVFIIHGYEDSMEKEAYYGLTKEEIGYHFAIILLDAIGRIEPYNTITKEESHSTSKRLEEYRLEREQFKNSY